MIKLALGIFLGVLWADKQSREIVASILDDVAGMLRSA